MKAEIQHELAVLHPTTVSEAIRLAKLVETKLQASKPLQYFSPRHTTTRPNPPSFSPHNTFPASSNPPLLPTPTPRLALPAPPLPKPSFPIRKQNKMLEGLKAFVLIVTKKFHRGHRCKSRQFLLLLSDEDPPDPPPFPEPDDFYYLDQPTPPIPTSILPLQTDHTTFNHLPEPPQPEKFHLSLHAFTGQPTPKTLRFQAAIRGHIVSVLIDTGSSHNILQPRIAAFLGLPIQSIDAFDVMVGNGAYLKCDGFVPSSTSFHSTV